MRGGETPLRPLRPSRVWVKLKNLRNRISWINFLNQKCAYLLRGVYAACSIYIYICIYMVGGLLFPTKENKSRGSPAEVAPPAQLGCASEPRRRQRADDSQCRSVKWAAQLLPGPGGSCAAGTIGCASGTRRRRRADDQPVSQCQEGDATSARTRRKLRHWPERGRKGVRALLEAFRAVEGIFFLATIVWIGRGGVVCNWQPAWLS